MPWTQGMRVYRFLTDVPALGAWAGDELCVNPGSEQFPAVVRRTFALHHVLDFIADAAVTECIHHSEDAPPASPRRLTLVAE